ncbi:MFS transporter [bacterium]|nr:MFS transporter [bacterium]
MTATHNKQIILVAATAGSFLTPFMGSAVNIALPTIGRDFGLSAIVLSWIATSYLLAAAVFLVPFGKIADIYGRRKIFTSGIMIYALASFLSGIAWSPAFLIVFRVMQGIGGAMIFGTGVAIITSVFSPGERGKALGFNVAAVYLGLSLGPFLGGFITGHLGWRSIFFLNAVIGLLVGVLIVWKLEGEWAEAKGESFDWGGSVIFGCSLAALMYGFSRLPAAYGGWLILASCGGIAGFIIWELKVKSPVLPMNLFFRNRVFAFSNLAALINYSATSAVGFLMSLYLQYVKGLRPQEAGLILVSQPLVQAVFSPLAGRLSDRIESRIIASAGMTVTVMGLVLLTFLDATTTLTYIGACLVVLGFGFALFSSPNTNAIMSSVDKRFYGVASATVGTMRLTGQMLSMGIAMLVLAVHVGNVKITPENHPLFLISMKTVFILFAALCFGGIFASLSRGNVR